MASNKLITFTPTALGTAAANIVNPAITSLTGPVGYTQTQPYVVLRHVRLVNTTAAAITVQMFKGASGASAAGTEVAFSGTTVPANSYLDWYGSLRLDSSDFLTGLASNTGVTFNAEGEVGLS